MCRQLIILWVDLQGGLRFLPALVAPATSQDVEKVQANTPDRLRLQIESTFIFSLVWAVGGTGATNSCRADFNIFVRHACAGTLHDYAAPSGER